MASIRREIHIDARPEDVWAAVRDVGAVHQRLVPGVLTDARLDGDARVVTFANGTVVRELIVDVDDQARRFAYAAAGEPFKHHNASWQVFADGRGGTLFVWITDVLPDALVPAISPLIDQGLRDMKQTLERQAARG
ncbi:SRPBCC family protein [Myxococcus sp. RHSTA-1-4]|uniref:SRPBCC family protein n=1 Tax=Myxococcus sp. RHSTA-1-4 TaxID=2874601 RepID=UPI001CBE9421|nr:SRPBCC family protein [Myxococcus sp. RHSTA-1-4]MBZ4419556.1 SRPBCC family protein [Myxococcus sp. RHSTA-1-4]